MSTGLPSLRIAPVLLTLGAAAIAACYVGPDPQGTDSFHADPDAVNFGYVEPEDFSPFETVSLINGSNRDVEIQGIRLSDDSDTVFTLNEVPAQLPMTLGAGAAEDISVGFAPNVSGEFQGTIEVTTDGDTVTVALGGCSSDPDCTVAVGDDDDDDTGDDDDTVGDDDDDDDDGAEDQDISVDPSSVNFGDVPQNQASAGDVVTISNVGGAPLLVNSVEVTGADASLFGVGGFSGGTLQPGGAPANLNISFNAAAATVGPKSANLVITSDDPDEPTVNIPMSANVVEPCIGGAQLEVVGASETPNPLGSPPTLYYVLLTPNVSTDVTLSNSGCDALGISAIADDSGTIVGPNADITITGQSPALPWTLGPGETGTVTFQTGSVGGCDVVNVNGAYGFTVGTEADILSCFGGL